MNQNMDVKDLEPIERDGECEISIPNQYENYSDPICVGKQVLMYTLRNRKVFLFHFIKT